MSKFITNHGDKTKIHVGLVDDKPFFIANESPSVLKQNFPSVREVYNRRDNNGMALHYPQVPKILANPPDKHGVIKWIRASEYSWNDTVELVATHSYYPEGKWKSNFLNQTVKIAIKDYDFMLKNYGIDRGGLYTGLFCFDVYGYCIRVKPTRFI